MPPRQLQMPLSFNTFGIELLLALTVSGAAGYGTGLIRGLA